MISATYRLRVSSHSNSSQTKPTSSALLTLNWSWGSRGGGGGRCFNELTAGYRSRVTGGAGGVSLRAAGEQHAHVAQ